MRENPRRSPERKEKRAKRGSNGKEKRKRETKSPALSMPHLPALSRKSLKNSGQIFTRLTRVKRRLDPVHLTT